VSARPLVSALCHDEPTIEAFNLMGFDDSAVGNHEFDHGYHELLRLQDGGCHRDEVCDPDHGSPAPTSTTWPPT
jgi:5'-nucleotidase